MFRYAQHDILRLDLEIKIGTFLVNLVRRRASCDLKGFGG